MTNEKLTFNQQINDLINQSDLDTGTKKSIRRLKKECNNGESDETEALIIANELVRITRLSEEDFLEEWLSS